MITLPIPTPPQAPTNVQTENSSKRFIDQGKTKAITIITIG